LDEATAGERCFHTWFRRFRRFRRFRFTGSRGSGFRRFMNAVILLDQPGSFSDVVNPLNLLNLLNP
jgi:hypothetical protein